MSVAVALVIMAAAAAPAALAAPSAPAAPNAEAAAPDAEAAAEAAIRDRQYRQAETLLRAILARPESPATARALELHGVVQQRLGNGDAAAATFRDYLGRYAGTPGAARVTQRLAAIAAPATAAAPPGVATPPGVAATATAPRWRTELRGIVSQFYGRDISRSVLTDALRPDREPTIDRRVNVDQILTATDTVLTAKRGDMHLQLRAAGSITKDFRAVALVRSSRGRRDIERINALYFDIRDRASGLSARIGRQQLLGSGVFGRFDGVRVGGQLGGPVRLNLVAGSPVQSTRFGLFNDGRHFYGMSVDLSLAGDALWTSAYWIDQRASGLVDRRALGLEARYTGRAFGLHGIVDYDVHFGALGMARILGNYRISERSSLSLTAEQVHYPMLTTLNAIIGQAVPDLDSVQRDFDRDVIRQLARDRSQRNRSLTLTWSQTLSRQWQANADIVVTDTRGTPASGGVAALAATGTEIYLGGQVVGSGLLWPGDALVLGVRHADAARFRVTSADIRARIPVGTRLHFDPRLALVYRDDKIGNGHLFSVQPSVRTIFAAGRRLELEVEVGANLLRQTYDDRFASGSRRETSWLANLGYRFRF